MTWLLIERQRPSFHHTGLSVWVSGMKRMVQALPRQLAVGQGEVFRPHLPHRVGCRAATHCQDTTCFSKPPSRKSAGAQVWG
jgi:hypothetical protein